MKYKHLASPFYLGISALNGRAFIHFNFIEFWHWNITFRVFGIWDWFCSPFNVLEITNIRYNGL